MPKTIINEYDRTRVVQNDYSNFAVVVPGYVSDKTNNDVFDENGIYICNNVAKFKRDVGLVETENNEQIGNQIAYELLKQGYTVLYKKLDDETEYGTEKKKGAEALETKEFWECLKDKSAYDFRYLITGGYYDKDAYKCIQDVATFVNNKESTMNDLNGRGDCIALVDVIEDDLGNTSTTAETAATEATTAKDVKDMTMKEKLQAIRKQVDGWTWANKYTAIFCPKVMFNSLSDNEFTNKTFPASFYYLACANNAFINNNYSEWYAASGLNRGKTPNYIIASTSLGKFGEIAVNYLEPRKYEITDNGNKGLHAVNVIAYIRDNYYLWGNRTAYELTENDLEASHFLNIRQLCCTLKKELYKDSIRFKYSPNTDLLWTNFCNTIRPTLEKMKADQGIRDYKLIKVVVPNKAEFRAKIRIVPIEAVEDFVLDVYLENSISGAITAAEEDSDTDNSTGSGTTTPTENAGGNTTPAENTGENTEQPGADSDTDSGN